MSTFFFSFSFAVTDFVKRTKIYKIRQGYPQNFFPQDTEYKTIKNCLN